MQAIELQRRLYAMVACGGEMGERKMTKKREHGWPASIMKSYPVHILRNTQMLSSKSESHIICVEMSSIQRG